MQRCPVCATPGGEFLCKACDVTYHQECWNWNSGCAILGCRFAGRYVEPEKKEEMLFISDEPIRYVNFRQHWDYIEAAGSFGIRILITMMICMLMNLLTDNFLFWTSLP